jgi:uncharacterized repeat protein (TIGR02543 family)
MNMTPMKAVLVLALPLMPPASARASIAYGSINNFDTVNDTGTECHGFEIELDDCHSTDISYTYDYNHYGTPRIRQDDSIPGHPRVFIRWESARNADGSWAAYTAIPSGPIAPTDGHMFTNPSVNFGGEHFGVGFGVQPSAILYHWLVDDGAGNLVRGGAVQVSTPVFNYYPPDPGGPAQVQAVIQPPPPPEVPVKEFGDAVWVKEIRTTTHNNREVRLRELVSEDPDHPEEKDWRNGEPDEVEVEWQILQNDYNKADGGANAELAGAPEDLDNGDEVVTRRYEFYKYTGPLDEETGEAKADSVGPDGIHGEGVVTVNGVEVDLSTLEVVGEYAGSQMAAVDVDAPVGLIDHLQEGEENEPYPDRKVVVQGGFAFTATESGALPAGMEFDEITGILSGTPTESGDFVFEVVADDGMNPAVSKKYLLSVAPAGAALPPRILVDTAVFPVGAATTTGDGAYEPGTNVTVTASALPGYSFLYWMENGVVVTNTASHTFTADIHHSLAAHFSNQHTVNSAVYPAGAGSVTGAGEYTGGQPATLTAQATPGFVFVNWTEAGAQVGTNTNFTFTVAGPRTLTANFTPVGTPARAISTSSSPGAGGTTSGDGLYADGGSVTVTAAAAPGYRFKEWQDGGDILSTSPAHTFTATADLSLAARFVRVHTITLTAEPPESGTVQGAGVYEHGETVTLAATPVGNAEFINWSENGAEAGALPGLSFPASEDRVLVANFTLVIPAFTLAPASPGPPLLEWPAHLPGWVLEECTDLTLGDWIESTLPLNLVNGMYQVGMPAEADHLYLRLRHP